MLYSIQNSRGKVYGHFPMPHTGKSPEVIAAELGEDLHGILGINGVKDSKLVISQTRERLDRVVVDIDPYLGNEDEKVETVHSAVARLAIEGPSL